MAKGFVKLNNDFISGLARLKLSSPSSYMVLFAIIRSTLCFHRNQYEMSNDFLANATGLNRRSVIRAMQELESRNLIKIVSNSCGSHPRTIRLLSDNLVTVTDMVRHSDNPVTHNGDNPVTTNSDNPVTQEIIRNNNIKEKEKKETFSPERKLTLEELAALSWTIEDEDNGNL